MGKALVWESVSWRCGDDKFRFDIERGGLFGTLDAPGGRTLTLPMVVWDAMLDALRANRSTRGRSEQQFPSRSRSRWYEGEVSEVVDAYKAGRTIAQIAHAHNRSVFAIEHQLGRLGLISTAELHGPGQMPQPAAQALDSRRTNDPPEPDWGGLPDPSDPF